MARRSERQDPDRLAAEVRSLYLELGATPSQIEPVPDLEERSVRALARILAAPKGAPVATHPPSRRRVARRPLVLTATAAVAVLVAVFVVVIRPGGGSDYVAQAGTPPLLEVSGVDIGTLPQSGDPAGGALNELAQKAGSLPYDAVNPVQHVSLDAWFAESRTDGSSPVASVLVPVRRDSYFFPDANLRVIERREDPVDQRGRVDDSEFGPVQSDDTFASPDPGPEYASTLPTDPDALRKQLLANEDPTVCAAAPGGCLMFHVIDLSRTYVLPPDVLSAMWEAMADEPSITYLGQTTDRRDRKAIVFTTPAIDGVSQQLLLADPESGAILGDEVVLVTTSPTYSFTPPAVTSFSMLVSSERIASRDVPPPAQPGAGTP